MPSDRPRGALTASFNLRDLAPAAAVLVVTAWAFSPALSAGFLDWDDNLTVVSNERLQPLDGELLRWASTTFYMGHYQPLSWISLALDRAIWGLDARGFHATNLALHLISSLLVYRLALFVIAQGLARQNSRFGWPERCIAAGAATAWAVHPQRVESVVWITERRDTLSTTFLLLSLLAYLATHRGGPDTPPRAGGRVLYTTFFALSLAAKASGITYVPMLLVLDALLLRRLASWRAPRSWLPLVREKWALILLSCTAIALAPLAQRATDAMVPWSIHPLGDRIAVAAYGWFYYALRIVVPWPLSPLYELPVPLAITELRWVLPLCLCAITALALLLVARRGRPGPLLVAALFTLPLLPVLGFFQSGPQLVADRYSYLPAIVAWVLLAWIAARLLPRSRSLVAACTALVLLTICWFGVLTFNYARAWRSTVELWQHAIGVEPKCAYCHEALGLALLESEDRATAVAQLRRALDLRPNLFKANVALASTLEREGSLREALERYALALRLRPQQPFLWQRVAIVAERLGDPARAAAAWGQLVRRQPPDPRLTERWFRALIAAGRCEEVPWNDFTLAAALAEELRRSCQPLESGSP